MFAAGNIGETSVYSLQTPLLDLISVRDHVACLEEAVNIYSKIVEF